MTDLRVYTSRLCSLRLWDAFLYAFLAVNLFIITLTEMLMNISLDFAGGFLPYYVSFLLREIAWLYYLFSLFILYKARKNTGFKHGSSVVTFILFLCFCLSLFILPLAGMKHPFSAIDTFLIREIFSATGLASLSIYYLILTGLIGFIIKQKLWPLIATDEGHL